MPQPFQNLVQLFVQSVADFADNQAFATKQEGSWEWVNYRDVGKLVDQARGGLAALGVTRGDRVAIVSNNRIEWVVMAFATYGLGASFVPMYESQQPEEWGFIIRDCGAKVAVGATRDIHAKLSDVTSDCPELQHVLGLELPREHQSSYAALLEAGAQNPAPRANLSEDDIAGFIYTSGTTGNPKGVKLSHRNICSNVQGAAQRFDFGPGDVSLAFLPWAHSFGQTAELYTLLHFGAAMAINDEVPNLVNNLAEVRPTVLVAVPRIFNRIYDGVNKQMADKPTPIRKLFQAGISAATRQSRGEHLGLSSKMAIRGADQLIFSKIRAKFGGRLRFVVSGSAALATEVAEFIDALGIDVFEGYGLTETSPVVSANFPGHRKIGSVGLPFPGVEVRIDKEVTGDPVNGEIVVRGPNVMVGYHNREEENAKVLGEDGSFRTGDMGYVDPDGYLYITGRIKEQYKLENGRYVVPSPLEEELKLSPFIINVMLHGANRPYNVALVVPDMPSLESWAKDQGVDLDDVTRNDRVKKLLLGELEKYGSSFKSYERPQDILVTPEDFTTENEMLTPSMKLKRRNVYAKYGDQLEALYGNS